MNLRYLRRALYGVGPLGFAKAVLRRVGLLLGRTPPDASGPDDPVDAELQIETAGFRSWRALKSGTPSDAYNAGYLPVDGAVARHALRRVEAPERFTFFDAGCGKGRALCLASEFGFRRIVGIEINPQVADIARRNARVIRTRFPSRTPIEVLVEDASKAALPREPLVVFLYRPFLGPVLKEFVQRLAQSLAEAPRDAYVIYVNPLDAELFDAVPALARLERSADPAMNYEAWRA